MTDREEREKVIEVLKNMLDWMEAANMISSKPERIEAVKYAIASIETDLKYDLLYEETSGQADKPTTKNDLAVDCISRAEALNCLKATELKKFDWIIDAREKISNLPSVIPIRPKGHWISHREHCEMNNLLPSGLGSYFWCSECDCGIDIKNFAWVNYNYCPNCGADMGEVEE